MSNMLYEIWAKSSLTSLNCNHISLWVNELNNGSCKLIPGSLFFPCTGKRISLLLSPGQVKKRDPDNEVEKVEASEKGSFLFSTHTLNYDEYQTKQ